MNKTEAIHTTRLLRWLLPGLTPTWELPPVSDTEALQSATFLAGRAQTALMAGPGSERVEDAWHKTRPTVVREAS